MSKIIKDGIGIQAWNDVEKYRIKHGHLPNDNDKSCVICNPENNG